MLIRKTTLLACASACALLVAFTPTAASAAGGAYGWSPRVLGDMAVSQDNSLFRPSSHGMIVSPEWVSVTDLRTGRGTRLFDHCPPGSHTLVRLGEPVIAGGSVYVLVLVGPDAHEDEQTTSGTALCRAISAVVDPSNTGAFDEQLRLVRLTDMGRTLTIVGGPLPVPAIDKVNLVAVKDRLVLSAGDQAAAFDAATQTFGPFQAAAGFGLRQKEGFAIDPMDGARTLPDGRRWLHDNTADRVLLESRSGRITSRRFGPARVRMPLDGYPACGRSIPVALKPSSAMIAADGRTVWALGGGRTTTHRCRDGQTWSISLRTVLLRTTDQGRTWKLVALVPRSIEDSMVAAVPNAGTVILIDEDADFGINIRTRFHHGRFTRLRGHLTGR